MYTHNSSEPDGSALLAIKNRLQMEPAEESLLLTFPPLQPPLLPFGRLLY